MGTGLATFVPAFIRPALRKIYYLSLDLVDRLRSQDTLVPPRSMIFLIGGGDFERVGQEFKQYFIELGNLKANQRVLDVGCGVGRMAVPLTNYLSQEGEYWSFDIVRKGIDWCQSHISSHFKNFHFKHADIYNKVYNPNGKIRAEDFQFAFESEYFDFVFSTSVFTHMLPSDVKTYLSETSRVLKRGGRCLSTFFLLNEQSENLIHTGRTTLDFQYKLEGCLTIDDDKPEAAIPYPEHFVRDSFENYGLKVIPPIHYGSWCKRHSVLSYQDIVLATKENSH